MYVCWSIVPFSHPNIGLSFAYHWDWLKMIECGKKTHAYADTADALPLTLIMTCNAMSKNYCHTFTGQIKWCLTRACPPNSIAKIKIYFYVQVNVDACVLISLHLHLFRAPFSAYDFVWLVLSLICTLVSMNHFSREADERAQTRPIHHICIHIVPVSIHTKGIKKNILYV